MRLHPQQIVVFKQVAAQVFGPGARVLLFGSRTEDDRRGGDIDLYVTGVTLGVEEQLEARLRFLVEVKRQVGEQRIDVVFAPGPDQPPLPIHGVAERTGILL